jgi:predicted NACHT family NTPase
VSECPDPKKAEQTAASDLQAGRDIYIGNITQIVNQGDAPKPVEPPQNNLPIGTLVEQVRSLYRNKIQYECGKMRLLNRQVLIDNLYTDVYILEELPHQRFADISDRVRNFDPTADDFERFYLGKVRYERVPGLDMVQDECKLMCLGAPGSGKTTYLSYVATQCNEGKLQPDRVPIFIRLIEYADKVRDQPELSLLKNIEQLFRVEGVGHPQAAQTLLKQGRVLVLLDGLDEVPQADSRLIVTQIREFCRTYHKNSIIVTCRTNALDYSFGNLGFTEVIVADFDQKQIEIFAHKWFMAFARNDAEAGQARAKQFIEKLQQPGNKRIRDLAVTPILLNLTCLVFQDIGNFPSNRAKLYQQGLNILLKEWDSSKGIQREELYANLSPRNRESLLTYMAAVTFTKNRYFFERGEIEEHIADYLRTLSHAQTDRLQQDSEAVLKGIEVQHGLLVERAREIYSFSHLTFQEYFTAKRFVEHSDWQGLISHLIEKRWREVFLLAVGLRNADDLLRLIKQKVDEIVATHQNLQESLSWINQKALLVQIPCKPVAVRAFYFAHIHDPDSEFGYSNISFPHEDSSEPAFSYSYDLVHDLVTAWQDANLNWKILDAIRSYALGLNHTLALAFDFAVDLTLTHNLNLDFSIIHDPNSNFDLDYNLMHLVQFLILACSQDAKLKESLQQLQSEFSELDEDRESFFEWWESNGLAWSDKLRSIMIEHQNIGHDWQFSEQEKELLTQYYSANQLLMDCLNSGCNVSSQVREEIEETLLLPIAEIEKRNSKQ